MDRTVLITGSARGLGLAFAKYYKERGWRVIACVRRLETAAVVRALEPYQLLELDVADEASIRRAAEALEGEPIDVLINNAGICEVDALEDTTSESLMRSYEINALGPVLVTRAFLGHLQRAVARHGHATVCQVSSLLGSVADQGSFGVTGRYGYKLSKAALNMFTSCFAWEHKKDGIIAVSLYPGNVATDMSAGLGTVHAQDSVTGMAKVLANLTIEDTGKFLDYEGNAMHW